MSDEKKIGREHTIRRQTDLNVVLNQLCKAFNSCPFLSIVE